MGVAVPMDPCYHYECAEGRFRLSLFLPTRHLGQLVRHRRIAPRVLEDFPDGVDLDCTEPDFADFQREYGYTPPHSPEALQNAFLALISSTRGWQGFRGSGLLPAEAIETLVPQVEGVVQAVEAELEEAHPAPSVLARTRLRRRQGPIRKARLERALVALPAPGVDPRRPLSEQHFRPLRMEQGMSPGELFSRVQRGERGGRGERGERGERGGSR